MTVYLPKREKPISKMIILAYTYIHKHAYMDLSKLTTKEFFKRVYRFFGFEAPDTLGFSTYRAEMNVLYDKCRRPIHYNYEVFYIPKELASKSLTGKLIRFYEILTREYSYTYRSEISKDMDIYESSGYSFSGSDFHFFLKDMYQKLANLNVIEFRNDTLIPMVKLIDTEDIDE